MAPPARAGTGFRVVARLGLAIVPALAVAGCLSLSPTWARGSWTKPGVVRDQQRRDEYECERRATVPHRPKRDPSSVYAQCMSERGYERVPAAR